MVKKLDVFKLIKEDRNQFLDKQNAIMSEVVNGGIKDVKTKNKFLQNILGRIYRLELRVRYLEEELRDARFKISGLESDNSGEDVNPGIVSYSD